MTDPERGLVALKALETMGITLSIDDFGTGYSSMSYLKDLPVRELKIDRSFVIGMSHNESDLVLVHSAVDLGHNLGMHVVAEGVEDAATNRRSLIWGATWFRDTTCAGRRVPPISSPGSTPTRPQWMRMPGSSSRRPSDV